jgi:hypothetical protein
MTDGELTQLSTPELLNRMPPIEYAPILAELGGLGLKAFKEKFAVITPTYENGIVDHVGLMHEMGKLVSPDYRWLAPFFDEHHLHWYAHNFQSPLAKEFRDLAIHKLWVPRQFHDFVHVMTFPVDPPDDDVMYDSVQSFKTDDFMWKITNEIMTLQERIEQVTPVVGQPGRVMLQGKQNQKARFIDEGAYEKRRLIFIQEVEERIRSDSSINLGLLSRLELLNESSIESIIPSLRREMGERVARTNNRRSARAVKLPIARREAA